jgi:hypothetical protein
MTRELAVRRFYWNVGNVGDGKGYSNKLSVKLIWRPKDFLIGFYTTNTLREHRFLYISIIPCLLVRLHWARSWGGRYK